MSKSVFDVQGCRALP